MKMFDLRNNFPTEKFLILTRFQDWLFTEQSEPQVTLNIYELTQGEGVQMMTNEVASRPFWPPDTFFIACIAAVFYQCWPQSQREGWI